MDIWRKAKKLKLNKEIYFSDLSNQVQIVVKDSGHQLKTSAGVFSECNHWTVNDFTTKKQLIHSGLGWGYMPFHQIQEALTHKKLIQIRADFLENFLFD